MDESGVGTEMVMSDMRGMEEGERRNTGRTAETKGRMWFLQKTNTVETSSNIYCT